MRELTTLIGQSIHLSIYTAGKLLVIAQNDSGSKFNYHVTVGSTFDLLETSSGRVILTFQSDKERQRRFRKKKNIFIFWKKFNLPKSTIKELEKNIQQTIHRIKKDGCEIVKSLQISGITNISFPIFDYSGYAIAALTAPFLNRLHGNKVNINKASSIMSKYSIKLSNELGYENKN